jgi:hypothetical protein
MERNTLEMYCTYMCLVFILEDKNIFEVKFIEFFIHMLKSEKCSFRLWLQMVSALESVTYNTILL